ncbi:16S rRNA (cytidine(1402)-2'-O)-methyltransferase [Orrella sp. 11846]|uniref:16S rRNA (cytidine(1402)-2'-O)-methyltransferase n=1 Tax=Orrella sp. 11846 TaxID=3409913 RepID=UPI003B5C16EF
MTQITATSLWDHVQDRLSQQQWPVPALYVVATPIGNLADLSPRARYTLQKADVIAAEDTRATRVLLQSWHIETALISLHRHNEQARADSILARLAAGERIALVSDAGAPGVSDPGGYLIQAVREAGYPIVALPGPSAVITTLMAFGTTTDQNPEFAFLGFLANKSGQRVRQLKPWQNWHGTLLCFAAPHRLEDSLKDLIEVFGENRPIGLARELTKRFEETALIPLGQAVQWLEADKHRQQGEYVLLIPPALPDTNAAGEQDDLTDQIDAQVLPWIDALLETRSTRDVSRIMADILQLPKARCYSWLHAYSESKAGQDSQ